ncbi:hypothetical protein ACFU3O_37190 [Streptomyces antibioticus]|uniref:hypothetical protein n=1 Tax=Streptomyces antibioticus TaxID=1890 RepID=UPI00368AF777
MIRHTADLRTWLIIAARTRLRLARVRRGFRHLRVKIARPADVPRPSKPGPGRPPDSKNRRPAPRHEPGKNEYGP